MVVTLTLMVAFTLSVINAENKSFNRAKCLVCASLLLPLYILNFLMVAHAHAKYKHVLLLSTSSAAHLALGTLLPSWLPCPSGTSDPHEMQPLYHAFLRGNRRVAKCIVEIAKKEAL